MDDKTFKLTELRSALFITISTDGNKLQEIFQKIKKELGVCTNKTSTVDNLQKALNIIYCDDLQESSRILREICACISYNRTTLKPCCYCKKLIPFGDQFCDAECQFQSISLYPF